MRAVLVALAVVTAVAATPAVAEAKIKTVGSSLPSPPRFGTISQSCPFRDALFTSRYPSCTVFQYVLPRRTVRVPANGRIVRWRLRGSKGRFRLRVLRQAPEQKVKAVGQSKAVRVSSTAVRVFTTNLAVKKNDLIAVDLLNESSSIGAAPARGAEYGIFAPKMGSGEVRDRFFGPFEDDQLLYNADVKLPG